VPAATAGDGRLILGRGIASLALEASLTSTEADLRLRPYSSNFEEGRQVDIQLGHYAATWNVDHDEFAAACEISSILVAPSNVASRVSLIGQVNDIPDFPSSRMGLRTPCLDSATEPH